MPPPLLIAHDATGHVHLVVGSNPLASARCTKSIEVGAKPKIVASADAEVHYALMKRIEDGEVEWIKKGFEDEMLTSLGRDEVDNVVDAVFVTLGGKKPSSSCITVEFVFRKLAYRLRRHSYIHRLPAAAYTSQCCRCSQSLHFHPPLHPLRWSSTDRHHYIRQRLQASFTYTP